jgi:hypothetical protein
MQRSRTGGLVRGSIVAGGGGGSRVVAAGGSARGLHSGTPTQQQSVVVGGHRGRYIPPHHVHGPTCPCSAAHNPQYFYRGCVTRLHLSHLSRVRVGVPS